MDTPILRTKFYIPPTRSEWVSRPNLIEQLHAGLHHKLTLISAPAGFGKTTLLSAWIASIARPVAWVSLDEGDNDPARFWTYVVTALQTIKADIGQAALAMLRSPQLPAIEPLLVQLINEIAAIPECLVLVLDDYHTIQAPAIHEALTFLLDHLPPQMHLVVASRADPPLPIALYRGRGEVTELRQADLRFTLDEAIAFLTQVTGLNLTIDEVAALTTRTEGWISGLQMAAISMRGRDAEHIPDFVAALTGSHEYIADYLSDQVFSQQSENVRAFLLQTSILDHMTGPLCDAVTGQSGGQQALERLKTTNLFVVSLDDERRWFRYHHLFASLLRQRLQQTQPDIMPDLHRRASAWYEHNGFLVEAVRHALQADDLDRVEWLVAQRVLAMIYHGELATLIGWLEALPTQTVRCRSWLCVAYAWVRAYSGRSGSIEAMLRDAERALGNVHEAVERRHIAGHIAAIRAYLSIMRREVSRAAALARESLDCLPEGDLMVRSFAMEVAAVALRMSGDLVAAVQTTAEAITVAQAAGADYIAVDACCDLARLQMARGRLREAAATCQDALRLVEGAVGRRGWPLPITGYVLAHISLILHERNDLSKALRHAQDSIEACRRWGEKNYLCFAYAVMARSFLSMGDAVNALNAIQQARQATAHPVPSVDSLLAVQETQIRLVQGDIAAARRCVQRIGLSVDGALEFYRYQEYHLLVRIHIACGELEDALALLVRLLELTEAAGATGLMIGVLVQQALALQAQGQNDRAQKALSRALELAEPEGYVRTFIDEGKPMVELLKRALAQDISTSYVHTLLAAWESGMGGPEPILSPRKGLIEPLSEREIEVLRLLTTHMSRAEIADQLYVSPNTIRFHLKNIYSKLGVHSRSDAVQRAEELNLL